MPVVLIIVGIVFVVSAVRGTHKELGRLLTEQFASRGGFTTYLLVLSAIAVVGIYKPMKPVANAFTWLVILVMFLSNSRREPLFGSIRRQVEPQDDLRGTLGVEQ